MEKLTQQEEEAMRAVWKTGSGNIKSFIEHFDEPPPYTTLASTVKNLEKKGYVKSELIGNTLLYAPTIEEADYKQKFLGNVVKDYFANSYKELVSFFVEKDKINAEELRELIDLIENKPK
ncbi:BlaI/MecI/CopY family transcriptional regulator [Persicitalea jodogahamensis]|uniref:Transcriptional regulator n=1 Tax=Persicitalea jodogahamensis TaxID=402147 RepID=A0A8J3GBL8_9BACT|nr:BlaI/MecI/CopY family transcriptional regulator [Persicitalea jodogahamensis]GHB78210.1 transcriptional regulator [Persicitalea jodogahamensis]